MSKDKKPKWEDDTKTFVIESEGRVVDGHGKPVPDEVAGEVIRGAKNAGVWPPPKKKEQPEAPPEKARKKGSD